MPRMIAFIWPLAAGIVLILGLALTAPNSTGAASTDDRTIEFVNMCPTIVRIGVNGAALLAGDTAERLACSADTKCPAGVSCLIPDGATRGTCSFDFPAPSSGSNVLSPAGGDECCGCPDWKAGGGPLPLAPGFSCTGTIAQWTSIAEPWVTVTKQACPTAYNLALDDATRTFTCSTEAAPTVDAPNAMNYKITFCPDGKTGE